MNPESRRPARILLVDDYPLIRHGLRALLTDLADFMVCGEADSIQDALHAVVTSRPDLVIVDLSIGGEDGLELIRLLRTINARLPVVVFSAHEGTLYAELAIMAGARGYVMKQESPAKLLRAIREALKTTSEPSDSETP